MKRFICVFYLAIAFSAAAATAQDFPSRTLRLVVPYPAGGAGDVHTRMVAQRLSIILKQPVIVENRPGASGNLGSEYVARSAPDGYTLVFGTTNMALNQALTAKPSFDLVRDLAPVALTLTSQNMLVVRPDLPVNTLAELIERARRDPGKLTFGSSGIGTPWLTFELLMVLAKIKLQHVPYRGDNPAIADLLGGQIDMYATNISALEEYNRSGRLRALGVTSRNRARSSPDVPTFEEAGVSGYELESWFGFLAPANTPKPVIERLNAAMVEVIAMPDMQKAMMDVGLTPHTGTPEEFSQRIKANIAQFARIAADAGIKPQ